MGNSLWKKLSYNPFAEAKYANVGIRYETDKYNEKNSLDRHKSKIGWSRFKMKKRSLLITAIILVVTAVLFIGCKKAIEEIGGGETELPEFIELSELNGYKIIRSEQEDKDTKLALADFRLTLKNQYNLDVSLMVDVEAPDSDKEILIGTTNRGEGVNHRYSDYSLEYKDNKIFISGGSAEAISAALDWFCNECISDGKLYVGMMPYEYSAQYDMEDLTLCGVPLKDFAIEDLNSSAASELHQWLGPQVGLRKTSESGYTIRLKGDYSLYLNEVSTTFEDKTLILASSACFNDLTLASKYLKNQIEDREGNEIALEATTTVKMPKPSTSLKDIRNTSGSTKIVNAVTDKDPLSYVVGDQVVFSCTLYADKTIASCPKFSWTATTEDGKTYSGKSSGDYGKLVVKVPATGAGVVRLKVMVLNENGNTISEVKQSTSYNEPVVFSAVVNADSLTAKAVEPSDFDAFWDMQLAKLDAVAPDVISMTKVVTSKEIKSIDAGSSKPAVDIYIVKIKTPDECGYASAYLTVPQGASPSSLGITVVFIGYSVGDITPHASAKNMVLTVAAHSLELNRESGYYTQLSNGVLDNYGFKNNDSRDTCYFRTMIMRDLQAVRFIKAYGGTDGVMIDGERSTLGLWNGKLTLYGGSQGAFQGIAVAALDKDVTDAQWSIPWMCDIKGMKSEFRPAYTEALSYFDSVFFGKRIDDSVNITILAGLGDYICPPSGVVAFYNALSGKVTLTFEQGMTHGYYPPNTAVYEYKKN